MRRYGPAGMGGIVDNARVIRSAAHPWVRAGLVTMVALLLSGSGCSLGGHSGDIVVSGRWSQASVDLGKLDSDMLPVKVLHVGWDRNTDSPVVFLEHPAAELVVPIWVGPAEGQAIAGALAGTVPRRPMTHDLIGDVLNALNGRLDEVWIHALTDNTYLGLLKLNREGESRPVLVDTRPSDGIALALRAGAAIRMHRQIIEAAGLDRSELMGDEVQQVARGLGMLVVPLTPADARERGISPREGVLVAEVGGEAEDAGVQVGDVMLRLGGRSITGIESFVSALMNLRRAEDVEAVVLRDGQELRLTVTPQPLDVTPRRRESPFPVA